MFPAPLSDSAATGRWKEHPVTKNTTADNVNIDAVMVRIKKLLALAKSPNENEAAAAAAKAQDLLFKYNLSMASVESVDTAKPITERYNNRTVVIGEKRQVLNWRRDLLSSIARLNFCRALSWQGEGMCQLIGKPENIDVTINLFEYLTATIDRLSAEGWEETKRANGGKAPVVWSDVVHKYTPQHAKNYRSSFSHGAVNTVVQRLKAQREENVAASEASSALVLVSDQELNDAVKGFYSNVRSTSQVRPGIDYNAYHAGKTAGANIGLNDQVGSGSAKALKG